MDGDRFDKLTKALAGAPNRRQLLKGLAGGASGGLLALVGVGTSAAARRCRSLGNSCSTNGDCCSGACAVTSTRGRRLCACGDGLKLCNGACISANSCCTNADCAAQTGPCVISTVCNPSSGACETQLQPVGTGCDDGDACTKGDSCQDGACVAGTPVVCDPADECHAAGSCNPATGKCSHPNLPNGTSCNDDNAYTTGDSCQAGVCIGGAAVSCPPSSPCLNSSCDPRTGCVTAPQPAGLPCSDGNACTGGDACDGAVNCVPNAATVCGPCLTCDPASGQCVPDAAQDGFTCPNSGNQCFVRFACSGGACVGQAPVVCAALDECHVQGTCDPATGLCSQPDARDGRSCDAGNGCLIGDCQGGLCEASPHTCESCQSCNPTSGACEAQTAGAECFRSCTLVGHCRDDGFCLIEPGGAGCVNVTECDDFACDEASDNCIHTGAKDGQACQNCGICRQGACIVQACPACQSCNPTSNVCETCNCCNGVCCAASQSCCDGRCCAAGQSCCAVPGRSQHYCEPDLQVCNGVCYDEPRFCCGVSIFGTAIRCPLDKECCLTDLFTGCCETYQVCGRYGCGST